MSYLQELIAKHRRGKLIVDTNLLLLYVVGTHDPRRSESFKRTNAFTREDFGTLLRFTRQFPVLATTPHILTEVSSFLKQLAEHEQPQYHTTFARVIGHFEETYFASKELLQHPVASRLGLTDAGIAALAASEGLVLTDDLVLSNFLGHVEITAINFNHLRYY